jgi:peptidoglycan-associated lipoprotein
MKTRAAAAFALASLAVLAAGCASTRPLKAPAATAAAPASAAAAKDPATAAAAPGAEDARSADAEPDVRDLATREAAELKTVHFAYDSDRLDGDAREILRANAEYLKARSEIRVQVAGNCDQRGTVAYNLALGQRRAAAVRGYYRGLGVDPARVATISYGRERPLCREENENCWNRNRRAATLEVLSPRVAASPASSKAL